MIRLAIGNDLAQIQTVYAAARRFMVASGNPKQWSQSYPSDELLWQDITKQQLYVEETDGTIHGVFVLAIGEDPTYAYIEGGEWLSDEPYGTIHRIASDGSASGLFSRCMAFCESKISHLRIDTHRDNAPMRRALEKRGFTYCGIIYLENGDERLAYQRID